jgi:hypothetical protein
MAASKDAHQQLVDHLILTDDHVGDLFAHSLVRRLELVESVEIRVVVRGIVRGVVQKSPRFSADKPASTCTAIAA